MIAARASARSPSGCSTSPARGCSTAASGCSPRRCWPSPSCPSSTRTWRSTTSPTLAPRRAWRCGGRRASCATGALRDYAIAGLGLGLAVRDEVHRRHRRCCRCCAGGLRPSSRRRDARALRVALLARSGALVAGRLRRGQSRTRCSTVARVPRRARAPVAGAPTTSLGKLGLTQPNGSRTTCGRSPGGWAGCRRRRARWRVGLLARAEPRLRSCSSRRRSSRALHGRAGALLRSLAAARVPDRVPAGGGYAVARLATDGRARTRGAPGRRRCSPLAARCCCWARASHVGAHRAACSSRADTRALTRDWLVAHVPAGHADRRRAGRARRVGRRRRPPVAATANGDRWSEVHDAVARTSPTTARSSAGRDGS